VVCACVCVWVGGGGGGVEVEGRGDNHVGGPVGGVIDGWKDIQVGWAGNIVVFNSGNSGIAGWDCSAVCAGAFVRLVATYASELRAPPRAHCSPQGTSRAHGNAETAVSSAVHSPMAGVCAQATCVDQVCE
jgi:hypothetical protein